MEHGRERYPRPGQLGTSGRLSDRMIFRVHLGWPPDGKIAEHNGGYRTSHVGRAVTVGNEAPVPGLAGKVPSGSVPATPAWPSPAPSSATTTPSTTSRSDQRTHARLGLVTVAHRSVGEPTSERPGAITQRSSARYRHWPFRCCSSPAAPLMRTGRRLGRRGCSDRVLLATSEPVAGCRPPPFRAASR